jgi:hypothetical protein
MRKEVILNFVPVRVFVHVSCSPNKSHEGDRVHRISHSWQRFPEVLLLKERKPA